jgi:regulation of enolase protein 1 (concanavalin A-like superfamily)
VALVGAASESNGVYTVQGSGNIAGMADRFRFVYQSLSGDGDITARINSMTTNGVNRCVGVMIRESLAPNSRYAFMGIGQNLKFRWQRRNNTGGATASTTSTLATPPNVWARLTRTNNTLYGFSSTNGVNWTKLASANITMATNVYVGFVVASGNTNALNTSVFPNVSVTP